MSGAKSETARVEAFSDGVIAIAATLLILEVKVPHLDEIHSAAALREALLHLWPSFFAFVYSFGTIFVAWFNHHRAIDQVARSTSSFMYANGFLLMTITFLPFPTALLAEYLNTPYAQPAIVFFCASSLLHNLGWLVLLETAIRTPGVLHPGALPGTLANRRATRAGGAVYLATTILAWSFPLVALAINTSIWFLWIAITIRGGEERPRAAMGG